MTDSNDDWQPGSSLVQLIELTVYTLQDPRARQPLIEQPRLTQRYLARPPFRFIHDIVTSVQQQTGFAPGLYSGDELDSSAIQGRNAKVAFLFKIMSVVSIVLHSPMPADPFKVVAGLEPENTNIFLQMLGKACTLGDAADIVQAVLQMDQQSPRAAVHSQPHDRQTELAEDGEPIRQSSEQEYEGSGQSTPRGLRQKLSGAFSKLQGQFMQRFSRQEKPVPDSPRLQDAGAWQKDSVQAPRDAATDLGVADCGSEEPASAGCLHGLHLSQHMRRLSRSTSAMAMFKRNGSVVHPLPEKQAVS